MVMTTEKPTLADDGLDELDKDRLIAIIQEQREQIARLVGQVHALQDQLAKNSRNSGKPPSSDGLKKPSPKSLREKGKRTTGGQKGHKGHTLKMVETPDHVVRHAVKGCSRGGADLRAVAAEGVEKRQVF